jgi:hypothetical protein
MRRRRALLTTHDRRRPPVPRNRSDIGETEADIDAALKLLRSKLYLPDGSDQELALCTIETFCDVAIRVMKKTNPSKLRDCARTVEIKARLDGVPVLRGAA